MKKQTSTQLPLREMTGLCCVVPKRSKVINGITIYDGFLQRADGCKYQGEWKEVKLCKTCDCKELPKIRYHGFGILTIPNELKYQGEWRDGNREGYGIEIFANGVIHDGIFKDNVFCEGKISLPDGPVFQMKSIDENKYRILTSDGTILETNICEDGTNTILKKYYTDGSIFEGVFNDYAIHYGKKTFPDGSSYVGTFNKEEYNGKGKFTSANGDYYDGYYVKGKKHGNGKYISDNEMFIGEWINDQPTNGTHIQKVRGGGLFIDEIL